MRARSGTPEPARHSPRREHDADRCRRGRPGRRLLGPAVRLRARVIHRTGRDPPGIPAPAHAAHVDHQRDFGHRDRRLDHRDGRGLPARDPPARRHRPVRLDDQHRERVPHHRPHAQDVQDRSQAGRGWPLMSHGLVQLAYIVATGLFVFALHWMNAPATARKGVYAGVAGMALAIVATWAQPEVVHHGWIVLALIAGVAVGVPLSKVPLTAVPQRTALSHAFGGLAAGLVGTAKYYLWVSEGPENLTPFRMIAIIVEVLLGYLTFTGSLMAAGKLQEVKWIPQRPVTYPLQNVTNLGLLGLAVLVGVALAMHPAASWAPMLFPVIIAISLVFGVLLIIPIGGADMPTVIAILNSYAGLAAVAMGFVLDNKLLITAGALDGSSGLILAIIMCRAMNRSFTNVLFGAFVQTHQAKALGEGKEYKAESIEGAGQVLEQANLVVIIPGYGMAVAQAQHKVRELYDQLKKRGITVKFAIHPVAGRMPGHMNVLLAEADIPYTDLVEMDEINPDMPQADVALVVGANDVVNPAARTEKTSPIYGMPIIDADRARTVFAIKRSKNPGFAGIDNELYFSDKTWMLFGDAKNIIGELVKQLSGGSGLH